MGHWDIDQTPGNGEVDLRNGGGRPDHQEWIRANFTQIFGVSVDELRAQGRDPRQYAREHRDQIRRFAQMQRSRGMAVPAGRAPGGGRPGSRNPDDAGSVRRGDGYGGYRRFGRGMRGGTAWIGILLVLFAFRFLLVDSLVGTHAAIFWVLGIGGALLVARVVLFSWLRRRPKGPRWSGGRPPDGAGFP